VDGVDRESRGLARIGGGLHPGVKRLWLKMMMMNIPPFFPVKNIEPIAPKSFYSPNTAIANLCMIILCYAKYMR